MKKLGLIIGLGAVAYLGTVYVVDSSDQVLSQSKLTQSTIKRDPVSSAAFKVLTENGCGYCHTDNSEMPFYANLPIAKQLMQKDVESGLRHFQFDDVLNSFKDNKCSTCHAGQAMGGQTFEVMGLKADYFSHRGNVSEVDNGRFNVTNKPDDMNRFKVPTLRNIALTAPYFHDGSVETLDDAVATMAVYQVGVTLTKNEIADISAYLRTLTGDYNGKTLN